MTKEFKEMNSLIETQQEVNDNEDQGGTGSITKEGLRSVNRKMCKQVFPPADHHIPWNKSYSAHLINQS